jgi:hypothetical protein
MSVDTVLAKTAFALITIVMVFLVGWAMILVTVHTVLEIVVELTDRGITNLSKRRRNL